MILNPYYMDVFEWTDNMNQFYEIGTGTMQKLLRAEDWQNWAMNLVGDPDEIGRDAPIPYDFDDWREWASLFFLTQDLVG